MHLESYPVTWPNQASLSLLIPQWFWTKERHIFKTLIWPEPWISVRKCSLRGRPWSRSTEKSSSLPNPGQGKAPGSWIYHFRAQLFYSRADLPWQRHLWEVWTWCVVRINLFWNGINFLSHRDKFFLKKWKSDIPQQPTWTKIFLPKIHFIVINLPKIPWTFTSVL